MVGPHMSDRPTAAIHSVNRIDWRGSELVADADAPVFRVTTVSLTDRNLMYSHSARMNTLPNKQYSVPRPAVQPATKLLVRCSCIVCDTDGTKVKTGARLVITGLPN